MSKTLISAILFIGFLCFLEAMEYSANERPAEATLPGDRIKPKVELSLVRPEDPHEGDDIQLECSARPKDRTNKTKPDTVHWIKGNVGVPEQGRNRPGAERFIREITEDDKGTVLFLLTIKDVEQGDADKYMCIVQVGETGYFTSNEVQVDIQPSDPGRDKVTVEAAEGSIKPKSGSKVDRLTKDEIDILRRKDDMADMDEDELLLLSKAMRRDKQIKKQREEEEKREEQERRDRIRREAEERGEKRKLALTQEEKDILERQGDMADMSPEELELLQQALKKELFIEAQKKQEEEDETTLTKEEEAILKRKDQIRDMSQDDLKLMASAVTKQKQIQEERRKKYGLTDEDLKDIPTKKVEGEEPITAEEVYMLTRKDDIMDLTSEEFPILSRAMKKEKALLDKHPELGDAMSQAEMFNILGKKGEIMDMSREELDTFMIALAKQRKVRLTPRGKANDPLEDEEEKPRKKNKYVDEL